MRLSPIPSLRHRNHSRAMDADSARFPPSFRIHRGSALSLRTGNANAQARKRPRVMATLRRGASALRSAVPKIKDVNVIDKYSRVIFPVSFLLFNATYWIFYVL